MDIQRFLTLGAGDNFGHPIQLVAVVAAAGGIYWFVSGDPTQTKQSEWEQQYQEATYQDACPRYFANDTLKEESPFYWCEDYRDRLAGGEIAAKPKPTSSASRAEFDAMLKAAE
jgi:hypothetical protein